MGMKLKSGADLCGFQLTNFCVQGEASAPSDAALGRKYFHTNATDDVATGISLLHRERIYLGEGAWRATAYLDDIAAINEKLNLITGDTDTDTLINNLKDLEEFLKDFSETDKLKSLLDGKLDKSGGTIDNGINDAPLVIKGTAGSYIKFVNSDNGELGYLGVGSNKEPRFYLDGKGYNIIHEGNIGSQTVASILTGSVITDANTAIFTDKALRWYSMVPSDTANLPATAGWQNGLLALPLHSAGTTAQIYVHSGNGLYFRGNTGVDWKTIAFTDSNVAWSQGLKHSQGAVGATVDASGNIVLSQYICYGDENTALKGNAEQIWAVIGGYAGMILRNESIEFKTSQATRFLINSSGNVGIGTPNPQYKLDVNGDVHITGNLIVEKEISAGGAGEESTSGSGSAEGVSEIFTPTSTSMVFNHNLGEDVIVQVYEKNNSVWNLVMVDVEITSATRVTLRFGKTETTQHKVVIMGV